MKRSMLDIATKALFLAAMVCVITKHWTIIPVGIALTVAIFLGLRDLDDKKDSGLDK